MSQKSLMPPDAGISAIMLVKPDFSGLTNLRDVWETQLSRLGRPTEMQVIEDVSLGAAIRAGILNATQPLVLFIVADYAFRPHDVRLMLEAIAEADMVIGVRSGQKRSLVHERIALVIRWINRVVFGVDTGEPKAWYGWSGWRKQVIRRIKYGMRVQDAECGLRLVRHELLKRCPVQSDGAFALVEMIAKINFAGGLLAEVPLSKPSDLPTVALFWTLEFDEKRVFRRPTFAAASDSVVLSEPSQPSVQSDADSCAQTHPS